MANVATGRFAFGANWSRFRFAIDGERIEQATRSFKALLGDGPFVGRTMLDVGCGSGLSSLVARRLGMHVRAFDYDSDSVACSKEVRQMFAAEDSDWVIEQGDALDERYMSSLGEFDVVYSWGVLHHTGAMWRAIENAMNRVAPSGAFAIAIYNDQGGTSRRWRAVKRLYHKLPKFLQPALVAICIPIQCWKDFLLGALRGSPLVAWRAYGRERGMSPWHDMVDWVGGYPFEVAKPEEIFEFFRARGFSLIKLKTCGGGLGCNEFVFRRL